MSLLRSVAAFACLAVSLGGSQLPDGADLIQRSQQALGRFRSLQFTAMASMDGGPMKMNVEMDIAIANPGRSRMEVKMQGMSILSVSDGDTTWVYYPQAKLYAKRNAALGTSALLAAMGVPGMPDTSKVRVVYRTTGE
jgi:outer membrane lipoprotein-sorting protein